MHDLFYLIFRTDIVIQYNTIYNMHYLFLSNFCNNKNILKILLNTEEEREFIVFS